MLIYYEIFNFNSFIVLFPAGTYLRCLKDICYLATLLNLSSISVSVKACVLTGFLQVAQVTDLHSGQRNFFCLG